MPDDIIDFKSEKDRRSVPQFDEEQQRWNILRSTLAEAMLASNLSSGSVTSAAINALLSTLDVGNRRETIQYVIDRLAMLERLER